MRGLLRVDSLLGGRVSCSLSRRFSSCLGVLKMSTAATEEEIRVYLTTSVDSKPGIPAGLAEPIVEYLAKLGLPLEGVKALTYEEFTLAYKAVHDKDASDFELNYFKKFFGVAISVAVPDPPKEKEPTLSGTDDGLPPSARPLNTHKTVDKDGKLPTGLTGVLRPP